MSVITSKQALALSKLGLSLHPMPNGDLVFVQAAKIQQSAVARALEIMGKAAATRIVKEPDAA